MGKIKKISMVLFLITFSTEINAGVNGLTVHSRANCINNESISWDLTQDWMLLTKSKHSHLEPGGQKKIHFFETHWEKTWRSAAVHWKEGESGGWTVEGDHWIQIGDEPPRNIQHEVVTDCSIYDGWWDKDKEIIKDKERFYG